MNKLGVANRYFMNTKFASQLVEASSVSFAFVDDIVFPEEGTLIDMAELFCG